MIVLTPIEKDFANAIFAHHRQVCGPGRVIDQCVITYGDLCEQAGYPDHVEVCGRFVGNVGQWCYEHGLPPINPLVVNAGSRMPGHGYDGAFGVCSELLWPTQARAAIDCTSYPQSV